MEPKLREEVLRELKMGLEWVLLHFTFEYQPYWPWDCGGGNGNIVSACLWAVGWCLNVE